MRRKLNRSPEEMARREKISEMLQALDISSILHIRKDEVSRWFAV